MSTSFPFTLAPLPGEPFGLWWHTYALRLGVTRTELASAAGIPATAPPGPEHAAAIATAARITKGEVTAMFTTTRPCPPEHVLRVWTPQPTSRFCLQCLADGSTWRPAWALPLTLHCVTHDTSLTEVCPACGHTQPNRTATTGMTGSAMLCARCDRDLTVSDRSTRPRVGKDQARAQHLITTLLARIRDPAATAAAREQAQDELTDLTLIALHLTHSEVSKRRGFTHHMPSAAAFTKAARLAALRPRRGKDPLVTLVSQCSPGPRSRAIPFSWRAASPALTTRITRGRDTALTPIERLRHATILPTPIPRSHHSTDPATDPAVARAARLPDQLWPAWAIRLTDDDAVDGPVFRSAMIAALLLPLSGLQLAELTSLLPHQPGRTQVSHQLRRLTATPNGGTALRVLTELGLALDHHEIPIDYPRRRRLATASELIDRPTWIALCRDVGLHIGRQRRLDLARRYLYELLTGGNLATAPEPYHLDIGAPRVDHVEFCATMPASLMTALTRHAEHLLAAAGITGEPLTWQPPADWITVTDWPGADPDHTDPGPIHHALRAQWAATTHNHRAPTQTIAATLGISSHHLRHVLRQHPIDQAPYPRHRPGAVIATTAEHGAPGYRLDQPPGAAKPFYLVDPTWLHEQYTTWHRSLTNISTEIGCRPHTLRAFAEAQGIPRRPRSGASTCIATAAITTHPAELPDPLRTALLGRDAHHRIKRFLIMTEHPSLTQAAVHTGLNQPTLTAQLKTLERSCGGPLFQRPHSRALGSLTPLGEQLCHQARQYLDLTPHA